MKKPSARHRYLIELDPGELDLGLCVSSGQVFRWERRDKGWIGVDGDHWFNVDEGAPGRFEVESNASEDAFRALFRLDASFEQLSLSLLESGPELGPFLQALPGFRLMRPTSPHETLFSFVCTANNHLTRIGQMVRKLAAYGEPMVTLGERTLTRFPTLERIASISEAELREAGFGYRGKTIPILARELLCKPAGWLESLRDMRYEDVHSSLASLYGIGPKLADCVALYGLEKIEATPIDTHMWQALCRIYFTQWSGLPLTGARYREAGAFLRARFGLMAGTAHLFLYYENLANWRSRARKLTKSELEITRIS